MNCRTLAVDFMENFNGLLWSVGTMQASIYHFARKVVSVQTPKTPKAAKK